RGVESNAAHRELLLLITRATRSTGRRNLGHYIWRACNVASGRARQRPARSKGDLAMDLRLRSIVATLGANGLLFVAACGDDDDSSTATTAASATTAAPAATTAAPAPT